MSTRYSLPVAKNGIEVERILDNHINIFMTVPAFWEGGGQLTGVRYQRVPTLDERSTYAYEVFADNLDDAIDFISYMLSQKIMDKMTFVEFILHVKDHDIDTEKAKKELEVSSCPTDGSDV